MSLEDLRIPLITPNLILRTWERILLKTYLERRKCWYPADFTFSHIDFYFIKTKWQFESNWNRRLQMLLIGQADFYTPASMDRGHIVFGLSTCLQKPFYIGHCF